MKLSLSWIFDHINTDYKKIDVPDLVRQFNKITAEIESFQQIVIPVERLLWAKVLKVEKGAAVHLALVDSNETISLPFRSDLSADMFVLLYHEGAETRWALLSDMASSKDGIIPPLQYDPKALSSLESHDYIIEIDNKSITHRPDMWGHRGVAREIAAILDLSLVSLDKFLAGTDVATTDTSRISSAGYSVVVDPLIGCSRFASAHLLNSVYMPSSLQIASRLARIDSKPINNIVDLTNYVMFDLGHPMHAFDMDRLPTTDISVRRARPDEKLLLLDDQEVTLVPDDLVIASNDEPVSLAGVMGGKETGINKNSKSILIEAAHFDGATIRKTALRYKKRTESSARFEKELDPNGAIPALQRFIALLQKEQPEMHLPTIFSIGKVVAQKDVSVAHSYLQNRLGIELDQKEVVSILKRLDFQVSVSSTPERDVVYTVQVPTFRATKDISMKDDLVEEVGRFIGYDMIEPIIPALPLKPTQSMQTKVLRTMRHILSFGLSMKELSEYAFFDEQFLKDISWEPESPVSVINPVSENWKRLLTTLMPNMLKAVRENSVHHEKLRFFEWGRVWHQNEQRAVVENKKLAGIMFDAHAKEDFYTGKMYLEQFFHGLRYQVNWHTVPVISDSVNTWFEPYQAAYIMQNNKLIGVAGMVCQKWVKQIAPKGSAFAFEFDGEALLLPQHHAQFVPLTKYPVVYRDISIMISSKITAATLKQLILGVDQRIKKVELVDFFEKDEWIDKKAMTYRLSLYDQHKTLIGEEVDQILCGVIELLTKQGAVVR